MALELPELNRLALKEQLLASAVERNIEICDCPPNWADVSFSALFPERVSAFNPAENWLTAISEIVKATADRQALTGAAGETQPSESRIRCQKF